VIEAKGL
jgi:hypothetical protein